MKKSTAFTLAEVSSTTCAGGRKNGFTLAEVLITLGIIGVVAAMTMPTLINQTNGAQYKAAYKKALSAISQAVTLNVALDDASFADTIAGQAGKTTAGNGATDDTKTEGTTIASLLAARMNIVRTAGKDELGDYALPNVLSSIEVCKDDPAPAEGASCTNPETKNIAPDTYLFFNDGIMFAFDSTSKECTKSEDDTKSNICTGVIDVNGTKGPNKVVTCDGKTEAQYNATVNDCTVTSPTDIYPVVFFDQTVLPATDAGKAVLYGK